MMNLIQTLTRPKILLTIAAVGCAAFATWTISSYRRGLLAESPTPTPLENFDVGKAASPRELHHAVARAATAVEINHAAELGDAVADTVSLYADFEMTTFERRLTERGMSLPRNWEDSAFDTTRLQKAATLAKAELSSDVQLRPHATRGTVTAYEPVGGQDVISRPTRAPWLASLDPSKTETWEVMLPASKVMTSEGAPFNGALGLTYTWDARQKVWQLVQLAIYGRPMGTSIAMPNF